MTINKGKQFESIVKKSFEKEPNTYVLRLYDTTNGFIGIANPCDLCYNYIRGIIVCTKYINTQHLMAKSI